VHDRAGRVDGAGMVVPDLGEDTPCTLRKDDRRIRAEQHIPHGAGQSEARAGHTGAHLR